jgi:hypothetical protein
MPRCSQPSCRIAETGVCLDGHDSGCPHQINDNMPAAPEPSEDRPKPEPVHRIYTGERLSVPEASAYMNERPARMVLCVGAQESGKTTFFARLAEMFYDGSFAQYLCAWSYTPCAFQRVCWLATVASGATRPDTRRTDHRENDTFFHLRVGPKEDPTYHLDLMLSDLAGETFSTAIASREFCANLRSLVAADHLVIFLDCAQLIDPARRHSECDNARAFLQRVTNVRHEPKALRVQVLFSRWDYIRSHPEREVQERRCEVIEADLKARFGQSFAELEFRRIAARPNEGSATNNEIQSLFAHWLETPLYPPTPQALRTRQPARDFSAFGLT